MNPILSKYLFYYPVTLLKGELVGPHLPRYRARQHTDSATLAAFQREKLGKLLQFASLHSPFYAGKLESAIQLLKKGAPVPEALETVPYLTKQDLINSSSELCTYVRRWSSTKTTGGSTGEPVVLYKNPGALARERAATWRAYEWAGVGIGDKQARFWGVPHTQVGKIKAGVVDFLSNRERVSAFNLSSQSLADYYLQLRKYKPAYLYGYVSVIEMLANHMRDNGLPALEGLKAVITTSEVLTDAARERISQVFCVSVFNEYGCGEVGSIAHECEHGGLHIMADNMYVELLGAENSEKAGEIVVTDFFNYAMPLIRYRLGDFATQDLDACPCGRTLPKLKGIHGRAYDLIRLPDGKSLHPESVMYIFESVQQASNAFKHFQAVQTELDTLAVKIVPTDGWGPAAESEIRQQVEKYISSSMRVSFEIVAEIPREKSGKMRVVKSNLAKMA